MSLNRNSIRKTNGFIGSYKKNNQSQIQNNIIDEKIQKIIISDS